MYIIDKNNNSVEYEIYMNERRDDEEALALKKYTHAEIMNIKEDLLIIKTGLKKYTHAEVMDLIDEKTKSQKLAYESEIKILKSKLDNIYDDISTLLDGGFAVEWDRQHLHAIQSTTLY